jgi:DNA polymerase I-like protein with 3'-5' exonuclease and polymerase domains
MYADKEFCYALPNHLIQGGGADVVKQAMIEIDRTYRYIPMVLQVHDQLVFEMNDDDMKEIPKIKEIMESIFPMMNGMRLSVDVSVSRHSLAEKDMVKWDGKIV